ncbi:MAG: hypothetical protein LBT00_05425 [Spirochaetaceae bacterium]|nr:hypothetical protein [Spirochaetaceae bacterium]
MALFVVGGGRAAMTGGSLAMTGRPCHCEERSDEAIQTREAVTLDCFATLAMTRGDGRSDGG